MIYTAINKVYKNCRYDHAYGKYDIRENWLNARFSTLFLKVFNVGEIFDSRLSQVHIVAPLYEKHFLPFADFRVGISKSDLVLRNSLLLVSESLENISVR